MGRRSKPMAIGERYGCFLVIGEAKPGMQGRTRVRVRCDCGTERTIEATLLRTGRVLECHCDYVGGAPRMALPIGFRSGRQEVIAQAGFEPIGGYLVRMRCDCGTEHVVIEQNIRRGIVKSCGCLARERTRKGMTGKGRPITLWGETMRLTDWCKRYNISVTLVMKRIERGATLEAALTRPISDRGRKNKQ